MEQWWKRSHKVHIVNYVLRAAMPKLLATARFRLQPVTIIHVINDSLQFDFCSYPRRSESSRRFNEKCARISNNGHPMSTYFFLSTKHVNAWLESDMEIWVRLSAAPKCRRLIPMNWSSPLEKNDMILFTLSFLVIWIVFLYVLFQLIREIFLH